MKKISQLGFWISAIWFLLIAGILYTGIADAASLKLNEWGDFLAGATAPLALMWIVIGYFLQGEELRLNTRALQMQEQELKNQVRETAQLAANSERQAIAAEQLASAALAEKQRSTLKDIADSLPIFKGDGGIQSAARMETTIKNLGATVSSLEIVSEAPGVSLEIEPKDHFSSGAHGKIKADGATSFPFMFRISFTDRQGRKHSKRYEMTLPHNFREVE